MTDAETRAMLARRARWPKPLRILHGRLRLFLSALAGIVAGALLPAHIHEITRALAGWNVAVLLYLASSARLIGASTPGAIRRNAQFQDEGRLTILIVVVATACASMGAIVAELAPMRAASDWEKTLHVGLAALTMLDSWLFLHLSFAFHYAHEYYLERRQHPEAEPRERGGLIFPDGNPPDYLDFLYFAFVIGVATQTADISTASRAMRTAALVHGILAFFYNTTILALAVNIASGLT